MVLPDVLIYIRMREAIEKQDKERNGLEQRISKEFGQQIKDFEDAIYSIEEQKHSIYTRLDESMGIHNQVLTKTKMYNNCIDFGAKGNG